MGVIQQVNMILNNVEVNVLASLELIDAYNKNFPENFIHENVIYCVHNNVNNKNYIGQTVEFFNRFSLSYVGHFRDYNRFINGGLGDGRILYAAWKKYGLEAFTVYIIDTGVDRKELDEREMYWIKTLHTCTKDPDCLGYNLTWGADDMGVKDPESIKRSLATRLEKYGEYFANCHTPEAFAKGRKTKLEKYGQENFVNAFTPEANEKRRQTNLERYGKPSGPGPSQEFIDKMVAEKIALYGDPMGTCNTPENREKAVRNMTTTKIFKAINRVIEKSGKSLEDFVDFKEYSDIALTAYSSKYDGIRHLRRVKELLNLLKGDTRWTPEHERILGDIDKLWQ